MPFLELVRLVLDEFLHRRELAPDDSPSRPVAEYNPDWRAATELSGDRLGWMKIWREFVPLKKLVQHKTYKFEKGH